jgi:Ca-activated chloride channel family protein
MRKRTTLNTAPAFPYFILFAVQLSLTTVPIFAQQPQPRAPSSAAGAGDAVRLTVTVTDGRGRYVSGLGQEHFEVLEGKAQRGITDFSSAEEPMSVGVLYDISGSVGDERLNAARAALVRFIRESPAAKEYFIGAFSRDAREVTDWTRDAKMISAGLDALAPSNLPKKTTSGNTALYDACAAALDKFARASLPKRVLLLFTDTGGDNSSRQVEFRDLKEKLRRSGVLFYAVAIYNPQERPTFSAAEELNKLAEISGGKAFFPSTMTELATVMDRIVIELQHQYTISFAPGGASEWNKIRVRVTPPADMKNRLYVRSREGYPARD